MKKRRRRKPVADRVDTCRVELPIAPGATRYEFCVDDVTMESLANGICPEVLALQCHGLLKWKRDGERAVARKDVTVPLKPFAVVETPARRRATR